MLDILNDKTPEITKQTNKSKVKTFPDLSWLRRNKVSKFAYVWPMGLSGHPMGLSGRLMGLYVCPMCLSGCPMGLSGLPTGLSGRPMGLFGWPNTKPSVSAGCLPKYKKVRANGGRSLY